MKHLIYIYCYNIEILDEFIENCYPLVEKFNWVDLHIDFCEETINKIVIDKIKNKKITYGLVENRGTDVLPYIKYLYKNVLNNNKYSVITKIHSKIRDDGIRKTAYIPIVSDFDRFQNLHKLIEKSEIPIIVNNQYMVENKEEEKIKFMLKDMNKILNLTKESGKFFHGTMFMTSKLYMNKLFNVDYQDIEYKFEKGKPDFGYAHVMERMFGYAVEEYGGKLEIFNSDIKFNKTYKGII
jgi:lipopolysaccharide biosynthesis protein